MKRIIIALALVFLSGVAQAQAISTTTCPGAGCIDINTSGQGSIGIQITGTWVGTVTFQSSLGTSSSSTFTSLIVFPSNSTTGVTTTTGNGIWTAAVAGINQVRVVFTAYTSGTANVVRRTTVEAKANPSSGGSSGAPADATYITQIPNASLSNEQALSLLSTGVLKSTTATGVVSLAASPDIIALWSGTCNASSVLVGDGTCGTVSSSFTSITSGTNTTAAMILGSGSSLSTTGTGAIVAPAITAPIVVTGAVGSSAITINGATQTASFPVINATQTWNNVAVAFTGIKLNVTNTTSLNTSLLIDLQVGGTSQFSVDEIGNTVSSAFEASTSSKYGVFGVTTRSDGQIGWSNTSTYTGTIDVAIVRDAAAILAQRNSTNAQTFRIYETFTDASNYERYNFTAGSDALAITATSAGTGSANLGINLTPKGTSFITITSIASAGTAPAVANVGANSCGTSAATIAGNDNSGEVTVGATAGTQCRITFTKAATTRWNCNASNNSAAALVRTSFVDSSHTDLLGTFGAGDVVSYLCTAR